jgi:hypothetical protein
MKFPKLSLYKLIRPSRYPRTTILISTYPDFDLDMDQK